jgi:hypothetical protein
MAVRGALLEHRAIVNRRCAHTRIRMHAVARAHTRIRARASEPSTHRAWGSRPLTSLRPTPRGSLHAVPRPSARVHPAANAEGTRPGKSIGVREAECCVVSAALFRNHHLVGQCPGPPYGASGGATARVSLSGP